MSKKISIIGLGWFGMALAEELVKNGHSVKGTKTNTRVIDQWKHQKIKAFHLELVPDLVCTNTDEVFNADCIVLNIPPSRQMENAVEFYQTQMESLIPHFQNGRIEKVIFISSTSVFEQAGEVDEKTIPEAKRISSQALINAEKLLLNTTGFRTDIIRPGGLVGPGRDPGSFLAGKKDVSGPDEPVNLVHLDDLINLTIQLIEHDYEQFIFHAVAKEHPLKKDFYTKAATKSSLRAPKFKDEKAQESKGKTVSSNITRRVTGYKFGYDDPFTMPVN